MSPICEKIRIEIAQLPNDEQFGLYAELRERFEPEIQEAAGDVALSAAWHEEIESRLDDVKHGRVKLIPGSVVDREIDAFFVRHSLKRLKYHA